MTSPKTAKPAPAAAGQPASNFEQLGSGLDPTNILKPYQPQAPDDRGEDDLTYFVRRPGLLERLRFPFADEFAIEPDFVVVQIERDPDGWPKRSGARRRLIFSGYGEGHA